MDVDKFFGGYKKKTIRTKALVLMRRMDKIFDVNISP
jgi:hypothetical protein